MLEEEIKSLLFCGSLEMGHVEVWDLFEGKHSDQGDFFFLCNKCSFQVFFPVKEYIIYRRDRLYLHNTEIAQIKPGKHKKYKE